jgi:carbonic anhydrase
MGSDSKINDKNKRTAAAMPAFLSSSIIAVGLTVAGTGISQFLSGSDTFSLVGMFALILFFNIGIAVLWKEITQKHFEYSVLAIVPGFSLGFILTSIHDAAVGAQSKMSVYLAFGAITGICLWLFETKFWKSMAWMSALYTLSGMIALTLYTWKGLDAWSISQQVRVSQSTQIESTNTQMAESFEGSDQNDQWGYSGELGPDMWGNLSPKNASCLNGQRQSPIDIPKGSNNWNGKMSVMASTETAFLKSSSRRFIEFGFKGATTLKINSEVYQLRSMQIHTPSEHTLRGLSFPVEMQFYFQASNGKKEALSVFSELGDKNSEVEKFVEALSRKGSEGQPNTLPISMEQLIPTYKSGYRYEGSLTSPPCTEGIHWVVFDNGMTMSHAQAEALRKIHPLSARPVRPIQGRVFDSTATNVAH